QTVFRGLSRVSMRHCEHRPMRGAGFQQAARITSRERVLEVRTDRERFHRFVGKLFGEDAAQAGAKFFAGNVPGGAREIHTNEFEATGLETPEALHCKSETLVGMVGDR